MDEEYYVDEDIYALFWVYLSYFIGFIFFVLGYYHNWTSWYNYAFFMILLGMLINIGNRVLVIEHILIGADIKVEFVDDGDDDL